MARVFIIEDDKVADAIELLLEKKKKLERVSREKIHPFSDYEPRYSRPRGGCGTGGCGGYNTHDSYCGSPFRISSGCGSGGCGGYRPISFGAC